MASRTHNTAPGKAAAAGATRGRWTLKPSKQTCYALAGLMGVGFIGGAGLYTWQKAQIDALSRQVAQKQEQVDSGEKIARRLIASESAYAETQSQLQYLETSVTAGQYVPTLLRQMENLAKSVNLQVSSIRPKLEPAPAPPADKEARKSFKPWPYDKIHVDMEVRGNYWSVARLLYRLTEFPKILAVSSVQVQSQGEVKTGSSPVLTATVKLTGFIFPNDGNGVAAPGVAVASAAGVAAAADAAHGTAGSPFDQARTAAGSLAPKAPPVVGRMDARRDQPVRIVEGSAAGAKGQ